jgi:hypothetical protein
MRSCIQVETQVLIDLSHLGNGNTLQMCGEVFGMVECTTSIIVRDFCETIISTLKL